VILFGKFFKVKDQISLIMRFSLFRSRLSRRSIVDREIRDTEQLSADLVKKKKIQKRNSNIIDRVIDLLQKLRKRLTSDARDYYKEEFDTLSEELTALKKTTLDIEIRDLESHILPTWGLLMKGIESTLKAKKRRKYVKAAAYVRVYINAIAANLELLKSCVQEERQENAVVVRDVSRVRQDMERERVPVLR